MEEEYAGEYEHMEEIENIRELKKEFNRKFDKMTKEELEEFDEEFAKIVPFILDDYYGGYHPRGKHAEEKRQKYVDYIYMYMIAHDKRDLDERYDQPLFYWAHEYAEEKPKKNEEKERLRA